MAIYPTKVKIEAGDTMAFILKAINEQIEREIEIEFDLAEKRIKDRKAQIIAGVLLKVQKMYSAQAFGENITFSIKDSN